VTARIHTTSREEGMRMKNALLATVFAASVGPALGEPVDLTMYTFYTTDVPFYEQVAADYEKAHPDVTREHHL